MLQSEQFTDVISVPATAAVTALGVKSTRHAKYVEHLNSHGSHTQLAEIEAKRGVSFAEQTVRLFSNYIDTLQDLSDEDKQTIEDFLFSNNPTNPITLDYEKELLVNELRKSREELTKKTNELALLKKALNNARLAAKETPKNKLEITLDQKLEQQRNIIVDPIFKSAKAKATRNDAKIDTTDHEELTPEEQKILEDEKIIAAEVKGIKKLVQSQAKHPLEIVASEAQKAYQAKDAEFRVAEVQLNKLLKTLEAKFESYGSLCKRLSCAKPREVEKAVAQKNEELTNKFIFLLRQFPGFIAPKSTLLNFSRTEIPKTDGTTVEILEGLDLLEAIAFGITTPCCLSLPASGTKYLYAVLFDPRVSMAVVKDRNGHAIATSLISDNGGQIGVWHVDASKFYDPTVEIVSGESKESLARRKKLKKTHILRKAIECLGNELARKSNKSVFIAPGEATLANLGFLDEENTAIINDQLRRDLLRLENIDSNELEAIKREVEQDRAQRMVSGEKIKTPFETEVALEVQDRIEKRIDASVGGGRTDVGSFKYLAYALENLEELSAEGQTKLKNFISTITGWTITKGYTEAVNGHDIFELNKDDGHGLCKLQFTFANSRTAELEGATSVKSPRLHLINLTKQPKTNQTGLFE